MKRFFTILAALAATLIAVRPDRNNSVVAEDVVPPVPPAQTAHAEFTATVVVKESLLESTKDIFVALEYNLNSQISRLLPDPWLLRTRLKNPKPETEISTKQSFILISEILDAHTEPNLKQVDSLDRFTRGELYETWLQAVKFCRKELIEATSKTPSGADATEAQLKALSRFYDDTLTLLDLAKTLGEGFSKKLGDINISEGLKESINPPIHSNAVGQ